jgi:murein DD-endopeptidase MepM/ murein hydrolase activator NlpD
LAAVAAALGLPGCAAVILVPVVAGVGKASGYGDDLALFGSRDTSREAAAPGNCVPAGPSEGAQAVATSRGCATTGTAAAAGDKPEATPAEFDMFGPPPDPRTHPALFAALTVPEQGERYEDGWAEPPLDEHHPDDADVSDEAAPSAPATEPSKTPAEPSSGTESAADEEPPGVSRVHVVRKGDTLLGILTAAGMPRTQAVEAIDASRAVYDPRDLVPGQKVTIVYQPKQNGRVRYDLYAFSIGHESDGGVTVVRRSDDRFEARATARSGHGRMIRVRVAFDPDTSLFDSCVAAGLPANLVLDLIRIYSWEVDFDRDIQPGDHLDVVFTNQAFTGTDAENGLLYSVLTLGGSARRLYRFEVAPRRFEFFNERGHSAQTPLMRTPVQGAEFSSGFGRRKTSRYGFTRMHRGVDFRAPIGSPIFAAGDGVIERATFHRGYGYYVKVRHSSGHSTLYAHMQRPRKPVKVGASVRQGDVIGHVGMTGRTTGPHLHYEIHVNGVQVDPMTVKLASRRALSGHMLRAFLSARDSLDREIASLPAATRLARNERPAR